MSQSRAHAVVSRPEDVLSRICSEVTRITGVQLGEKQSHMVESRLQKRMHELGLREWADYFDYFEAHTADETEKLISILTTHHTFFFREFSHFEYLEKTFLPAFLPEVMARPDKTLKIWSAASSRGHEAYSLAMFLEHYKKTRNASFNYKIYGSDVDSESVKIASNGVYHRRDIKEVPLAYLADHWIRGTGDIADFVKIKNSIKGNCEFFTLNLITSSAYAKLPEYDVIFCRNVFIYFTPEQIKEITQNLLKKLSKNGALFVGISETLQGLGLPIDTQGPSIYQFKKEKSASAPAATANTRSPNLKVVSPAPTAQTSAPIAPATPLRVVCVDDSPVILTLMKSIFVEAEGFKIVGTAANGIEADKAIREHKPDFVTLDIHMPEMTGIEYLEKFFKPGHPPVVMVSSVSRENTDLAVRALKLGASDYVEKPALNQLKERAEEIRLKARMAFQSRSQTISLNALDQAFSKSYEKIPDAINKCRGLFLTLSDRSKAKILLEEMVKDEVPIVLLIEGVQSQLEQTAQVCSELFGRKVEALVAAKKLPKNGIFVADVKSAFRGFGTHYKGPQFSLMVLGVPSKPVVTEVNAFSGIQILLEESDSAKARHPLADRASDLFPFTSFPALSREYLCKKSGS